jgi:hypothetical protein
MIASLQLFAAIAQMIAKQSIQPNAASAMALEKSTKKHLMVGTKGRSANVLQIGEVAKLRWICAVGFCNFCQCAVISSSFFTLK